MQYNHVVAAIVLACLSVSCSSDSPSESKQMQTVTENNVNPPITTMNSAYDTSLLINQYSCTSETSIYSQTLIDFAGICQSLKEVEDLFVQRFGNTPIVGDNNNNRDFYIYQDRESYLKVGFNTSSYGKYIEQDPSDRDSHAEIYSYLLESGNVKNQSHEYIHYLDGRFIKDGDYYATDIAAWWTEGLAEYMQHLHWGSASSLVKESISYYGSDFSLSTIFSLTKDDYKTDYFDLVYDGGNVALCYFIQEEPEAIKILISHSRSGNWSAWSSELDTLASMYGEDFKTFVNDVLNDNKFCHIDTYGNDEN